MQSKWANVFKLTDNERRVEALQAAGLTRQGIADATGLSVSGVAKMLAVVREKRACEGGDGDDQRGD